MLQEWNIPLWALGLGLIPAPFLGHMLARLFEDKPLIAGFEKIIWKITGIPATEEQNWKSYARDILIFGFLNLILVFVIVIFQNRLPFNPDHQEPARWDTALNTAISFVTNTNWQSYNGETTLSHFSQSMAIGVQLFVSAATGLCVAGAFMRGLIRKQNPGIGYFYRDLLRIVIYLLLPLSIVIAVFFISQGVIQNYHPAVKAIGLEGIAQILPQGPAASHSAIKMLGSNGGGFFSVNAMHPYENPTMITNMLQMVLMLLIPASLFFAFGNTIRDSRQGVLLFGVALILLLVMSGLALWWETHDLSLTLSNGITLTVHNWEGKELRFGLIPSTFWSIVTTSANNGSASLSLQSMMPLTQLVIMMPMLLGGMIFGGLGSGFLSMITFVILTVFLAGLMIGRTPHYLGKRIDISDMKLIVGLLIIPSILILLNLALTLLLKPEAILQNASGFTSLFYALTSAVNNNGSAFSALNADTVYMNIMLGGAMLMGRYIPIYLALALAGSFAQKQSAAKTGQDFQTHTLLFGFLLLFVILLMGGLTFLPAMALGPVLDHLIALPGIVS